ncbi:uncharacterized protein LOC120701066 [Panicum virgatum]|uniref:DUF4220 domain-containing protein n=1 Tax=Panicum virgatum TaxID=38727 RepID=A0A8T0V0A2_PANVG|nr:uncharacterized protein LOC120701066 [Panicum virgatum]KAG2629871.1 hypothetical protein PVAP13_3KG470201 [Panicum virgatum]KAG2629872.1 hypothetical protein PVAP13_3KG470201 [Panicum virgatum]
MLFDSSCGARDNSPVLAPLVYNLTIFYAEADLRGNEAPLVATSVVMFALAVLFIILNLFSRYSDVSAMLNPSVRLFFSAALSLFLPAMSYLFKSAASKQLAEDLSVRARIILMWMLLVELLRKKVDAILLTAGGGTQGYSVIVQRATGVFWLGSLVFFNLKSAGKKALYGMIWVFVAAKFVQRSVAIEVGKRSFAYGKNPQLVAAYMPPMLELQQQQEPGRHQRRRGLDLLKHCNYAVMGEEELVDKNKAGPKGYKLDKHKLELAAAGDDSSDVVTVGRIWRLADSGDQLLSSEPRLKRLCLSFALFKMLRRRLEGYPISGAEAADCHRLIFHGLLEEPAPAAAGMNGVGAGEHAFQVFNDEVQFLCENYHSVVPVVLASPFFFAHNYVLFPVLVLALCFLVLVLCGNGDVAYAVRSLHDDNFFTSGKVAATARCVLGKVLKSTTFLFCAIDLSTTVLLALAVAYEEGAEYVVFLFSNWFMVSLLCHHTSGHEWRGEAGVLRRVIPGVLQVKNTLTHPTLTIKQFSVLWFLGRLQLPLPLPSTDVPGEAKTLIMERLAGVVGSHGAPLTNGTEQRVRTCVGSDELARACCSGGVAEVMLTWHVATAMLEARCARRQQHAAPEPGRTAAMALSGYCAYLVAFHAELLPDDKDGTEVLFNEMKKELTKDMGWCGYYGGGEAARCAKLMEIAGRSTSEAAATMTVLKKGARLGKVLIEKYKEGAREAVWGLLGDLWTEVVVYAAPTAGELHVKSHKEALAQGAELITVLWAITTHTGIARPEEDPSAPGTV